MPPGRRRLGLPPALGFLELTLQLAGLAHLVLQIKEGFKRLRL